MNKIILGLFAVTLCFVFAESLTCNSCTIGLFGRCLFSSTTDCSGNNTCYSGLATFTGISGFTGFSSLGCSGTANCNTTTNSTVFFANITVLRSCCSSDKCNQIINGAPSAELSLTAAVSAALVASVWNSWLH